MKQTKSHGKKSHGQRRKVGGKQFSIVQVHAQVMNPGKLNNQKKQVYILHIINIPKEKKKKKYQVTHQQIHQLGEIHLGSIFINNSKGYFLFFQISYRSKT